MAGKAPSTGIDIRLGEHEYRVKPQRHAYLKRELRTFAGGLSELGDIQVDDLMDLVTDNIYEALRIFIPDLMPRWEWDGFSSPEAADTNSYDPDSDRSPTPPEIKAALSAAVTVNEFDWVGQLKNFVGPDLIRNQVRANLAQWSAERVETKQSQRSPSLPPTNGASDPESSGTTVQPVPTT